MNPTEPGIHEADPEFDIRLDKHGNVVLLSLTGRLEGVACLVLQQYLVKVLVARIPPLLVVDVEGLTAADMYGRDILLSADRHAKASGGRLIVTGGGVLPGQEDGLLELFPSVDDALAELTGFRP
ncbi:STAS domain-containing protein [Nonomuraea sp. H19]|uniref:STAS domain-containing protein n=1 Tax=Nonomuraea sp. H19 TaxID=3452206 RepID=UPI003F893423